MKIRKYLLAKNDETVLNLDGMAKWALLPRFKRVKNWQDGFKLPSPEVVKVILNGDELKRKNYRLVGDDLIFDIPAPAEGSVVEVHIDDVWLLDGDDEFAYVEQEALPEHQEEVVQKVSRLFEGKHPMTVFWGREEGGNDE